MNHPLSPIKTLAAVQNLLSSNQSNTTQVGEALGLVGQTLKGDRAGLYKLSADGAFLQPLNQWTGEDTVERDKNPLAVDALENLDAGTGRLFAEPVFEGHELAGMLLVETKEPDQKFGPETRECLKNVARMLAPFLDVQMDAALPPKLSRPDEKVAPEESEEIHILIVEDDEANLFMIRKFIERFGAIPHVARDGRDAIQICKERKFDVILMDLTMPRLDGFDATREIVTGANLNRKTPIIAVTADVTEGIERRCKKIGMQHYIAKPIRRDTIIQALTDLTDKKPKPN